MMHRGFIKVWRCIRDWDWSYDLEMMGFFVNMIMMANWEDKKWQTIIIPRGSFVSSYEKLADLFHITYQQARNRLALLRSTGEITVKSTNKYSIYTIVNYDKYQSSDFDITNKTTGKRTDKQQASNEKKNSQTTTTKELKELKNEKNNTNTPSPNGDDNVVKSDSHFDKYWSLYPKKVGKGAAVRAWKKLHPSDVLREKIYAAVIKQKTCSAWLKDNGQFIPHASTWLNQQRWDDEVEEKQNEYYDPYERARAGYRQTLSKV